MGYKATNNAYALLASSLSASATSLSVQSGFGDKFPQITSPDFTYVTLENAGGAREIVKVTNRASASDVMTIVRGQENTSGVAWAAGDTVECRPTAGIVQTAIEHIDDATAAHNATAIAFTPTGNIVANNVQAALIELDTEKQNAASLGSAAFQDSSAFATAAQGVKADSALQSLNIGTTAGKIVALDGNAKLPAIDGSQLTNLPIPAASGRLLNIQYFTSTATYTPTAGTNSVIVEVVGGGGGSGGQSGNGGAGGTSSFGSLVSATGGSGGGAAGGIKASAGGAGSSGDVNTNGGYGFGFATSVTNNLGFSIGGASFYATQIYGITAPVSVSAQAYGGGGVGYASTTNSGCGGGGGGFSRKKITSSFSGVTVTVGAGGAAGSGFASTGGAAGAQGIVIVYEYA
jgi:hypothetical protein